MCIRDSFQTKYGKAPKMSFTGHSLGAVLAELCALEVNSSAVTFESPGTRPMAQSLFGLDDHSLDNASIVCYNAAPNAINTTNPHLGKIIRIFPALPESNKKESSKSLASKVSESYLSFSSQQHGIETLLKEFHPTNGQPRVYSVMNHHWPEAGRNELKGMDYYLNYGHHPHWWHHLLGEVIDAGPIEQLLGESFCLLYTSPSPRDATLSRMPSSA